MASNPIFHTSRFTLLLEYLLSVAGMMLGVVLLRSTSIISSENLRLAVAEVSWLGIPLIVLSLLGAVYLEMKVRSDKLVFEEDNLVVETGILNKETVRVQYHSIANVNVRQSFLQRLLGYGDIEIGIPGQSVYQSLEQRFAGRGEVKVETPQGDPSGLLIEEIQNPGEIEDLILQKIRERKREAEDYQAFAKGEGRGG